MVYADLRAEPGAAGRQHRPGVLRPGGLLRHRRLRGGAAVAAGRRRRRWPGCCRPACWPRRLYALVGGRAVAAHQGRVLHHGHAGLRADGLLRGARHAAGRRHRRHLPERQARCWARWLDLDKPLRAVRLHAGLPGWPCSASWRCCCARASAARWPASASTSSACAPPASRPTRTSWRPSRISGGIAGLAGLPVRGEGRLRQPRAAELAPVGRGADHDHPGRPGPPARRADRRLRLRAAAGVLQVRGDLRRLRQALAPGPGPDHHRQRGAAAARAGGHAGPVARTAAGPRRAARVPSAEAQP